MLGGVVAVDDANNVKRAIEARKKRRMGSLCENATGPVVFRSCQRRAFAAEVAYAFASTPDVLRFSPERGRL
jgi:hypothetical protein